MNRIFAPDFYQGARR